MDAETMAQYNHHYREIWGVDNQWFSKLVAEMLGVVGNKQTNCGASVGRSGRRRLN